MMCLSFFFLMIRRPPRSTLFPTRRSSDLTFPFGAHVVVVEVDVESGKAEVARLIAVDDAGTILNPLLAEGQRHGGYAQDRKSTRLNSSHANISYAVFCLKKKKYMMIYEKY